jgi:hypothetical protein
MPFRHARVAFCCRSHHSAAGRNLHVGFRGRMLRLLSRRLVLFLFQPRPHFVDFGGVKICLDVRRVIFLDHFDTGAAVFGDLVDVGTFHEAKTDIGVPQAVRRSRPPFPVDFQVLLFKNRVEDLTLPFRKDKFCRLPKAAFDRIGFCGLTPLPLFPHVVSCDRPGSCFQPFKRTHSARHTLAVPDTALPAHFDLKDGLAASFVFNDGRRLV